MYKLELTPDDMKTLSFVGGRYAWSDTILRLCQEGINQIPEPQAWTIREAIGKDIEGGHIPFPMLSPHCQLWRKLVKLWDEIV